MKKIIITLGLILAFANTAALCYASESLTTNQRSVKMADVVVFSQKGKFGLKDKKGKIIVTPEYKKLIRVGKTSWIVQKKSRYGIMDSAGNFLVQPKYRRVDRFYGKFVKLGNNNDYGLYDETGKNIIPNEFSSIDPIFGQRFLACKNFKYGVFDENGKQLLNTEFEDIYMPSPTAMRLKYEGEWYEIEQITDKDIVLPEGVKRVTINNKEFKVTHLAANTGILSGYSALTATDYFLKLFSSISPAYEQTIDDLMFSQGADGISVFIKMAWIPKFPFTYASKYFNNLKNPNNGPLADIRHDLKKQIK